MSVVTAEKFTTGNAALDIELPYLTWGDMEKLAEYAKYLRWTHAGEDDGDDWADTPLTEEEAAQVEEGRKEFANGEYLTLDEFMEGL